MLLLTNLALAIKAIVIEGSATSISRNIAWNLGTMNTMMPMATAPARSATTMG